PWTSFGQSSFFKGTSLPFEHLRPGTINRFAPSAMARELFSTASQPPYVLAKASVEADGSLSCLTFDGSLDCAKKIMLELGNMIPRITWARFPSATEAGSAGAFADSGAG